LSFVSAVAAAPSAAAAGDSLSASSSVVGATAVTPPLSIAQSCNRDCLSIILSFSDNLTDVLSAAQTCRSWRTAAVHRQSNCRANKQLYHNPAAFLQMLQSPLRVHLASLGYGHAKGEDLLQLYVRCPQLEDLTIRVDDASAASVTALTRSAADAASFNAHAWPPSLLSLFLDAHGVGTSDGFQQLIDALPSSAIGLRSLKIHISGDKTVFDLTPLLRLPEFTSLRVYPALLLPSQLAVVRQLRSSTELDLVGHAWNSRALLTLLADGPHQLQRLEKINIRGVDLDVEVMRALLTLPSLTELDARGIHSSSCPLLRSFVKLRKLYISSRSLNHRLNAAAVVELLSSLRALSELTSLWVGGFEGEPAVVDVLMDGLGAAVPQLRELHLHYFGTLPPLTAFRACTQLRTLRLTSCSREYGQSLDDVLQLIVSLPHLEFVEVDRCRLPLTAAQRMQFTPPSVLAPSLKTFHWRSWSYRIGQKFLVSP
jgi:hypothetical protein